MQYVPTTKWHQQPLKDDILTTILDITGNGDGNGKGNSQQNDIISMSKENDYTYYHH